MSSNTPFSSCGFEKTSWLNSAAAGALISLNLAAASFAQEPVAKTDDTPVPATADVDPGPSLPPLEGAHDEPKNAADGVVPLSTEVSTEAASLFQVLDRKSFQEEVWRAKLSINGGKVQCYYRFFPNPVEGAPELSSSGVPIVAGWAHQDGDIKEIERYLGNAGFKIVDKSLAQLVPDDRSKSTWSWRDYVPSTGTLGQQAPSYLPAILIIGGFAYLANRALKELNAGRFKVRALAERPEDRLDDIGGCAHVVDEMREFVNELRDVRSGKLKPEAIMKGCLVVGAPGAGKGLLARAIAGESGCPFVLVNSAEIISSKWRGDGTRAILTSFAEARKARDQDSKLLRRGFGATGAENGMCILFFDEFDSIGAARNSNPDLTGSERENVNIVNALLAEMNGVDSGFNRGVIIFAATNHGAVLDMALRRPGRFTRTIEMPTPRAASHRKDILEKLARRVPGGEEFTFAAEDPFERLAKISVGDTGDYLRGHLMEAMSIVRRRGSTVIEERDLVEAFQRQKFGRKFQSTLSPERRELVCVHETGHALTALAFDVDTLVVSMDPRGETEGRVVFDPTALYETPVNLREIMRMVTINLGGRAAEISRYGSDGATDGAARDIETCRHLLRRALSVGMIGDRYSLNVIEPYMDMTDEYHGLVDERIKHGLTLAKRILDAVGEETMGTVVKATLELHQELVGDEANAFYKKLIPDDVRAKMREAAKEFRADFRISA